MRSSQKIPRFPTLVAAVLALALGLSSVAFGALTLSITGGPDGPTNDSTPTFTFTAEDADEIGCSIDPIDQGVTSYGPCSASDSHSETLADGAYTFRVRASDHPKKETIEKRDFVVDTVAPAISITSGPSGSTSDDSPLFGFAVVGASVVQCSIDEGSPSFTGCSHGTSHMAAHRLADGAYTFRVRAIDPAGNTAVATRSFSVAPTYALPPASSPRASAPRLMSPFPVVRLAGRLTRNGAKVRVLLVRAPRGSLVRLSVRSRCGAAKHCRVRRAGRTVGRKGVVRFRAFERRYRAGTVLEIRVSQATLIGKYTRFVIRRGKAPRRMDRCLMPGAKRGSRCPTE